MKTALAFLLFLFAFPAQAEEVRRRPSWCRYYDWVDYRQDLRYCHEDRQCRARVRKKARLCELI